MNAGQSIHTRSTAFSNVNSRPSWRLLAVTTAGRLEYAIKRPRYINVPVWTELGQNSPRWPLKLQEPEMVKLQHCVDAVRQWLR